MTKYRLIEHGHRRISDGMAKGIIIPCGWTIERLENVNGQGWIWIHYATMHPDDAVAFMKRNQSEYTDKEMIDWIQASPNPRLSIVIENWKKCNGGVSLRGAIRYSMETRPDAGFEISKS